MVYPGESFALRATIIVMESTNQNVGMAMGIDLGAGTGMGTGMGVGASAHCDLWTLQVEFNVLEAEAEFSVAMDGLETQAMELTTGTAMEDIYLVLSHGRKCPGKPGVIAGRLEYNADRFNYVYACHMADTWQVRAGMQSLALQHHNAP